MDVAKSETGGVASKHVRIVSNRWGVDVCEWPTTTERRVLTRAGKCPAAGVNKKAWYAPQMSRVYGDSTPFPHDLDYIQMLRAGVDCAVRLLSAQHSIRAAAQRSEAAEKTVQVEVAELNNLFESVQSATKASISDGMDRTVRTAAQIIAGARGAIDGAVRELEAQVAAEVSQAGHIADKARETMSSAINGFLEQHTMPGSRLCLQLTASPEANSGHVTIITPFGISAVFGVAIPSNHAWARPRRVGDFVPHLEVRMPVESGWLSKRVEMAALRIDRLVVSDVMFSEHSGALRLRKAAGAGSGYQVRVDLENGVNVSLTPVREDGSLGEEQPYVLEGADQASMLNLWQSVVQSSWELMHLRRRMVSASFGEKPLVELDAPSAVAEALVTHVAPLVNEISRRSGARGELVLRRNLGEGKREETYCTHSELIEKILVLPPDLRSVFAQLNLIGALHTAPPVANGGSALEEDEAASKPQQRPSLPMGPLSHRALPPPPNAAVMTRSGRPASVPPPASSPPPA